MEKVPVAIIGSGNIGTDLMYKIERSPWMTLAVMAGIEPDSEGLARAKAQGYITTAEGVEGLMKYADRFEIVFEATSARAHLENARYYREFGKIAIDATPAAIGPYVVPAVNLNEHLDKDNVNMITCGGQATIPIIAAINRVTHVTYGEIVATVASKSAGPGTRQNIDEFTHTTATGIEIIGGADKGKAIIILNPAEPPIIMRNTVYALVEEPDEKLITASVLDMVNEVQQYVPGYRLRSMPLFEGNKVMVFLEVEGAGDYLAKYAGNLDIMTAAATRVGEEFAKRILSKTAV